MFYFSSCEFYFTSWGWYTHRWLRNKGSLLNLLLFQNIVLGGGSRLILFWLEGPVSRVSGTYRAHPRWQWVLGSHSSWKRQFGLQILLSIQVVFFLLNPENSRQFGHSQIVVWFPAQESWVATNSCFTENHLHSWKLFSWSWVTHTQKWSLKRSFTWGKVALGKGNNGMHRRDGLPDDFE